ncbi:hypothetical protein DENIT_12329 [Pseudomonas veronii]|nr:hypothetical protein DENIT_12329 [Pseudomonas veronii]
MKCGQHVGGAVRRFDLPPMAVYQLIDVLTDTPPSGASPLPHSHWVLYLFSEVGVR